MTDSPIAPSSPLDAIAAELAALGVYTAEEAAKSAFARVLVLGPAKAGKTTCLALTAPKPLIINCDGLDATMGAVNQGAQFLAVDVVNRATWKKACTTAGTLVAKGHVQSIIIDTLSLLSESLLDDISLTLDGFDKWNELSSQLLKGLRGLMKLEAHVFITSHMTPEHDKAAGILPAIPGSSKIRIPAIVNDWVLLDVEAGRKPHERMWLLGPQKSWTHSGRNIRRSCAVEATVPALLEELGIGL
jgi:hypothetical protein